MDEALILSEIEVMGCHIFSRCASFFRFVWSDGMNVWISFGFVLAGNVENSQMYDSPKKTWNPRLLYFNLVDCIIFKMLNKTFKSYLYFAGSGLLLSRVFDFQVSVKPW